MPAAIEPPELVASRDRAEELLVAGDPAGAEVVLRELTTQWPERLGLHLKLARAIEEQGRFDQAREMVHGLLMSRRELPPWSRPMIARFGFAMASGVRLDIADDAIVGFMKPIFVSGDYERTEAEMLAEVLRPNDMVLEVGGGMGFIGAFATLTEPTVTVVSYEANPALMPVAARTMELNDVSFDMRNAMLGESDGTSDFFMNKAFWASSASHDYGGAEVIQVPVRSVSQAMAEHPFNVVVMDIEGGELDLVPLMDLSGVDRFVLETHPQITGGRAVRKLLKHMRTKHGLVSAKEIDGVHLLVQQT